ncbi:phospholipase D [Pochonia chlamydosporia 170]|uniref:Phospholipase D n=1 Tax=Pochonia chlamydosporia 170 TaxID=1380566 RepID=A0A179FJ73_METCM|nr:phospholipase D [Pochonia chlamydosporia 170]OAQ65073.1 phospholipase D [Pochonia chlamydosporia 170]
MLYLKNPDYNPDPNANTSIEGLRKLARDILQPAGVKVLYGFYGSQVTERSYRVIRDGLNENESIGVDGAPYAVGGEFTLNGPQDIKKRVMSTGLYNPMFYFGDCNDACTSTSICPRLRCAAESKVMGKVFGWTISRNRAEQATKMMGEAHVDGRIYGFVATHYYDHADTRAALGIITDWLAKNKDKRYLATVNDQPW